jgi:hypothetical protein
VPLGLDWEFEHRIVRAEMHGVVKWVGCCQIGRVDAAVHGLL